MEQRVQLFQEIRVDIARYRWPVFLGLLVVVNALLIVMVTNETRLLSIEYNHLLAEHDALEVEWRHLLLEQSSLSEHSRIRHLAQEKLGMKRPLTTDEALVILE